MRPFYSVRDRLAVNQDLVTYTYDLGCVRLVIPEPSGLQVAANLHAGHQGLDSMLRRARQCVYWPGMEGDLQHCRASCTSCETHAPSQPAETLIITSPPRIPISVYSSRYVSTRGAHLHGVRRLAHWVAGACPLSTRRHVTENQDTSETLLRTLGRPRAAVNRRRHESFK